MSLLWIRKDQNRKVIAMSEKAKTEATKAKASPVKIKKGKKPKGEFPKFSILAFRWMSQTFYSLDTGEAQEGEMWKPTGSVSLVTLMTGGRKKITGVKFTGNPPRRSFTHKRVFGAEALALALSGIFPCTVEEAETLIKQAKARQIGDPIAVLKSDLVPTSPDRFEGENGWLIVQKYPSSDEMAKRVNDALKKAGSSLRTKRGLKYRLVE